MSSEAERVRVVRNANYVKDCESLGEIDQRPDGEALRWLGWPREQQTNPAKRDGNTPRQHVTHPYRAGDFRALHDWESIPMQMIRCRGIESDAI